MALWQRVTFFEYMPILLGQRLPDYSGYDDSVDPSLDLFFSTVAFRYGHSALTTLLFRVGPVRFLLFPCCRGIMTAQNWFGVVVVLVVGANVTLFSIHPRFRRALVCPGLGACERAGDAAS